jgi:hypothetical protein
MIAVDETYISGSMKMDVSNFEGVHVKINGYGVNIDEYGIFMARTKSSREDSDAVKAYSICGSKAG